MHERDPYSEFGYFQELRADNPVFLNALIQVLRQEKIPSTLVYPPTVLLVLVPFSVLPWMIAQNLFLILTAGSLGLAAFLMWDLGGKYASGLCGLLASFILADCLMLLLLGNPAGIAVGFCSIAVWCFLKGRYAAAGVVLLALSLMIKPHDSGFVWLYLLLTGGIVRKRALQTLAVAGIFAIGAIIWIAPTSPHWPTEERNNIAAAEARGGASDPGPFGLPGRSEVGALISLQAALSVLKDNPHFYNTATFIVVGGLIVCWALAVLRKRAGPESALLALAAVSILTLLPVYHRPFDATLLLLAIPGCAVLWFAGGARRWVALGLTSAAILVTSEFPAIAIASVAGKLPVSTSTLAGKMMLLARNPAPVVLLAAGCFYLWVYIRYTPSPDGISERHAPVTAAI